MNLKNFIRTFSSVNLIAGAVMVLAYGLYVTNSNNHGSAPTMDAMKAISAFVLIFTIFAFISSVTIVILDAIDGDLNANSLTGYILNAALAIILMAWGSVAIEILNAKDAVEISESSINYIGYGEYALPLVAIIFIPVAVVNTVREW